MKTKLAHNLERRIDGEVHIFPEGLEVDIFESIYGLIMESNGYRFLIRQEDVDGADEAA